jgi:hypothetical protein
MPVVLADDVVRLLVLVVAVLVVGVVGGKVVVGDWVIDAAGVRTFGGLVGLIVLTWFLFTAVNQCTSPPSSTYGGGVRGGGRPPVTTNK